MIIPIVKNLKYLTDTSKFDVNPQVDKFIKDHGDEPVKTLVLGRKPINRDTIEYLETVSPNFKKKNDYPFLYHSFAVVNGIYKIDKRQTLSVSTKGEKWTPPEWLVKKGLPSERLVVPVPSGLTIFDLFNNIKKMVGTAKMERYSAKDNNCQHFMVYLLQANGLATPERIDFVKQDQTDKLFTDDLRKQTNTITDMARVAIPFIKDYLLPSPEIQKIIPAILPDAPTPNDLVDLVAG